jgi:hypothetical protein
MQNKHKKMMTECNFSMASTLDLQKPYLRKSAIYRPACRMSQTGVLSASAISSKHRKTLLKRPNSERLEPNNVVFG